MKRIKICDIDEYVREFFGWVCMDVGEMVEFHRCDLVMGFMDGCGCGCGCSPCTALEEF